MGNMDAMMSPDASPGFPSTRSGVRRVNNLPVYIAGGLITIFVLVMVLVASDRATKQNRPAEPNVAKAGSTEMFAREIAGDRKDGIVPPAATPVPAPPIPPVPELPAAVAVVRPADLDLPPTPPNSQNRQVASQRTPADDEADRIRLTKLHELDEAAKSHSSILAIAPRSGGSATQLPSVSVRQDPRPRDDASALSPASIQQRVGGSATGLAGSLSAPTGRPAETRTDASAFANAPQGDRWRLDSKPENPRSPYELRAGFVVPATLISGVNSALPGQIIAQVSQDVYDTSTGKFKLIPQGSRLVGTYSSEVAYGQGRILIAWQRIVFPDGKALDIGAMPGADGAGYAGFTDQVNNHYVRLFSSAFLMSGVTAGIALSQPQTLNNNSRPTAGSAMSEALGQQLGQVTAQLIAKNLNIAPTLEIRPGYRFNIIVTKDLTFSKPYRAFDY
jgi:type IV secretory pathway VirB10-like protein